VDYGNLESIVLIASKYDLDPERLVEALCDASENLTAHCGSLKISCRDINNGFATFLITMGEKVVWQFPVSLKGIQTQDVKDYITKLSIPKRSSKLSEKDPKIAELRCGMKGINVKGKIVEIPPAKRVYTRWGTEAHVSNVTVWDENEAIKLSLWNAQIDAVNLGDQIEIKNCFVSRFAGELQLRLGRKGTVSIINPSQQDKLL